MLFTSLAVSRREKGIYWVIDEFRWKELAWNQVEAFSRNCFMVAFSHLQTDEAELFLQIALYKDLWIWGTTIPNVMKHYVGDSNGRSYWRYAKLTSLGGFHIYWQSRSRNRSWSSIYQHQVENISLKLHFN